MSECEAAAQTIAELKPKLTHDGKVRVSVWVSVRVRVRVRCSRVRFRVMVWVTDTF